MSNVITGDGLYRLEGCDEPAEVTHPYEHSGAASGEWVVDLPPRFGTSYNPSTGRLYTSDGLPSYKSGPRIIGPWIEPAFKPEPGKFYLVRDGRKAKVEFAPPIPGNKYTALIGWIEGDAGPCAWSAAGLWNGEHCPHGTDLIAEWTEPKPPRVVEAWLYEYEHVDGEILAALSYARWRAAEPRLSENFLRIVDGKASIVEAQ